MGLPLRQEEIVIEGKFHHYNSGRINERIEKKKKSVSCAKLTSGKRKRAVCKIKKRQAHPVY